MGKADDLFPAVAGGGTGCRLDCAALQAPCLPKRDRPRSDKGCARRSHRPLKCLGHARLTPCDAVTNQ